MPDPVRSLRVDVRTVPIGDDGAIVVPEGSPLAAVAVPVRATADGPASAPGVPSVVQVAGVTFDTTLDSALAERRGFTGKTGETLVTTAAGSASIVHVGIGGPDAVSLDAIRRAGAQAVRHAGRSGVAILVLPGALAAVVRVGGTPAGPGDLVQAATEGMVLASYRFVAHKSDPSVGGAELAVVATTDLDPATADEGVRRGRAVAGAVCFARDLVNEPPSTMNPGRLAAAANAFLAGRPGVSLEVWEEQRIESERLGGLLGVARGSAEPPRLLRASYEPDAGGNGAVPHIVLVGKGITFDSGGLSLKTAEGMTTMKTDMSGAAAVLATIGACADLGVRARVTAIAPVTENMPGGRATKPGDVLVTRDGQTIEVLNTDAEGRLVLADGLALASELAPDAVVDIATLTGACVVALGRDIAGVFANDGSLLERVRLASERAGEPVWPLPLPDFYTSQIDSDVADMKNVGKPGQGGAIAAALLLARFAGDVPWAHLDIAGPARSDEDDGPVTKGGTGFGVRTLLELVGRFATEPPPPAGRTAP